MIDVHPPHTAAHTWKDFFIHMAAICLGLLIAIGLEQSVEYLHHRHEVAETRAALQIERQQNLALFALEVRSFLRRVPYLKTNLSVLVYVREHPHAPSSAWPGTLDWGVSAVPFNDSAWSIAQRDGVVSYMPNAEVADLTDLYTRLDRLRVYEVGAREAIEDAKGYLARTDDPSRLTPKELDDVIDRTTRVLVLQDRLGAEMQRLVLRHRDFAPSPSDQKQFAVLPSPVTPHDAQLSEAERQEYFRITNSH